MIHKVPKQKNIHVSFKLPNISQIMSLGYALNVKSLLLNFLLFFRINFPSLLNLTDFLHIHTQDVIRHIDIEVKHEREINYLGGAVHYLWFFIFLFFSYIFLSRLCLAASQKIIS